MLAAIGWAGSYEDGVEALKAQRAEPARIALEAATKEDPTRVEAWWELGWAHWQLEQWDGAVAAWTKVEALAPDHPDLEQWLGSARTRALLASVKGDPPPVETEPGPGRLTIAAAGDTMMGSDLRKGAAGLAPGDGEDLFVDVASLFQAADIAFLNLEGPLADGLPSTKCGPGSTSCYAFRTPTRYKAALVGAGIDVASLANNHAMDLGVPGQDATMAALDSVGIAHAGRYGDVAVVERGGKRVAFVAAHSGSCCLNVNRPEEIAAAVRKADETADLVVVSFHGGAEGSRARHVPGKVEVAWGEERGDVQALAHAAIDAGADLVIGHGPHVLRAMERYRGRLILYSLGNFVGFRQFGTQGGHGGTSAIVHVELAGNGVLVGGRVHALALDGESRPHPDPKGAAHAQMNELTAADFPTTGVRIAPDGTLAW
ncbi:MAG: CapA family protein [Myxococcales bacterium]|nr:CapA family protein [Myxococcales bacterium]MCB9668584.1 CapA family protein [Alphaproteobacteria bacterium]MCB9690824.1 CapA family protein [Alphaproteobacteria bacterium]